LRQLDQQRVGLGTQRLLPLAAGEGGAAGNRGLQAQHDVHRAAGRGGVEFLDVPSRCLAQHALGGVAVDRPPGMTARGGEAEPHRHDAAVAAHAAGDREPAATRAQRLRVGDHGEELGG